MQAPQEKKFHKCRPHKRTECYQMAKYAVKLVKGHLKECLKVREEDLRHKIYRKAANAIQEAPQADEELPVINMIVLDIK